MGSLTSTIDHGSLTGLSDNDHTGYVLRSILTTRGDLPVRGASDWTRLGVGGANTILTADGTDPAWSATPTVTTLTTTGLLTAGNALTVSAGTVTLPASSLVVGTTQLVTTATGVGVGTATPDTLFHAGNATKNVILSITYDGNAAYAGNRPGVTITDGVVLGYFQITPVADGEANFNVGTQTNHPTVFSTNNLVRLRIEADGNVAVGATTFGTSAAKVLGLGSGTGPTTFPADMTQMLSQDIGAGYAGLGVYGELGDHYTFGDGYMAAALVRTITGAVTDGYAGGLRLDPGYTAATAQTVARHNYIDVQDVSVAGDGPAAVTNACVFRFDAAAGTHKATIGATTKTTPGAVDGWVKINMNGAVWYVPAYVSTTA